MYVISVTQILLGAVVSNFCSNKFSATGRLCLELVVALNFFFCLQRIPNFLRIRLIRHTPALTPCASNSFCNRSGPCVSRVRLCAARTSTSTRCSSLACWLNGRPSRAQHPLDEKSNSGHRNG